MKYFVSSDIHGYFSEWQKALKEKGYELSNPNHCIVICGDLFDRGEENLKCLKFVNSLPDTNKILIRGNHEDLLKKAINRGEFLRHDIHNGTAQTCYEISGLSGSASHEDVCKKLKTDIGLDKYFNSLVNYAESENYIFVHSWIPTTAKMNENWEWEEKTQNYVDDWRQRGEEYWRACLWVNPFDSAKQGLNQTGKTIVFGHWHNSWPRNRWFEEPEWGVKANFDIFTDNELKIIGLDACTCNAGQVNILVLEDEKIKRP